MKSVFGDFRDMSVWQKSFALLKEVYLIIKNFPVEERYALTDDLKRASNSICHNIAEGYGRFEAKDKARFYKIARGSAYESISQLMVAESQSYLSTDLCNNSIMQIKSIIEELNSLIYKLDK